MSDPVYIPDALRRGFACVLQAMRHFLSLREGLEREDCEYRPGGAT